MMALFLFLLQVVMAERAGLIVLKQVATVLMVVMDWGVMWYWGHPVLIYMWERVWVLKRSMVRGLGFGVVRLVWVMDRIDFFFDNL